MVHYWCIRFDLKENRVKKIVAITAAALLALTACGTPIPGPGESYGRCGKKICVTQYAPVCTPDGKKAVWAFEVYRKDYLEPKGDLVYSRKLSDVKAEYEGISDSEGGKTYAAGGSKAKEAATLLNGSLTVTFIFESDELKYDLDWDGVC